MGDLTLEKIKNELVESVKGLLDRKTEPYDTQATVKRVVGDTAYIHIEGGVSETPVRKTINAKKGDVVQVRLSGGRAWLTGNDTAPPTDDTKAKDADVHAGKAMKKAVKAEEKAIQSGKTATSYMTEMDEEVGVFVHPKGTPSDPTDTNARGVQITDSVDVIRDGASRANFGEQISIFAKKIFRDSINGIFTGTGLKFISERDSLLPFFEVRVQASGSGYGDAGKISINSKGGDNLDVYLDPSGGSVPVDKPFNYKDAHIESSKDVTINNKLKVSESDGILVSGSNADTSDTPVFQVDNDGNIISQNHDSPIGTIKNGYPTSTVNVPSTTDNGKALCSVTLEAGVWLCLCGVRYPAANSGIRRANLSTTSGSNGYNQQVACDGNHAIQLQFARLVQPSQDTTYYLNTCQNSGSTVSIAAGSAQSATYISAIRLL